MNKKTVVSVMVVAMVLSVSLFFVGGTYARYVSKFTGDAKVGVAKWAVQLAAGSGEESTITSLTLQPKENTDVINGKIAPSVTAEGTVEIDLKDTEVSVDIFADIDENAITQALQKAGLQDVTNDKIKISTKVEKDASSKNITSITGGSDGKCTQESPCTVSLPTGQTTPFDETDKVKITVTVEWENDDANSENDTKIGEKAATAEEALELTVPVTLYAVQHLSTNYTPVE